MELKTIFTDAAKLTKNNLMVIQPLFLGVLILMFIAKPLYTRTALDLGFYISAAILVLCVSAFISGWYNCIKYTISLKDKVYIDKDNYKNDQLEILKQFFPGVSEYFLSITAMLSVYIGLVIVISYYLDIFIKNLLTNAGISHELFRIINSSNQQEIKQFIGTLSNSQAETLLVSFGILALCVFLFHFSILWFGPAVFYKTKNPFLAIFENFKFLFKNFIPSIVIFITLTAINLFISFLTMICGNGILSFIPFLCFFFYILYYIVTVFMYYEQKTKTCSINGSKFDREV